MKRVQLAVAAVSLCSIAASAEAQLRPERPIGSLIPQNPKKVDAKRTGYVVKGFARCMYRLSPSGARKLLLVSDPVAIDYVKLGTTPAKIDDLLNMDSCLGKEVGIDQSALSLSFSTQRLRLLLMEEDYLAHFNAPPSPEMSAVPVDRAFVASAAELPTARAIGRFSDCIVKRDVSGSDKLVRTLPARDEERQAARDLAPALSACLIAGQQLSLTPAGIRSYAVEGLWIRYARDAAMTGK